MYALIFYMQIPQEIIAIKRAYRAMSRAKIERLLTGVVSGGFRDYQVSALAVGAAFISGGAWCDHLFGSTCTCTYVIIDRIFES